MSEYLIIIPLLFLAGFVDSIAGGGGLISLPAYILAGYPPHQAIASNKFSACLGTTASTARFFAKGYMQVDVPIYIIFALLGSNLGSRLTVRINETYFKYAMLIVLPLVAAVSFYYQKKQKSIKEQGNSKDTSSSANAPEPKLKFSEISRKQIMVASLISLVVGLYDGLYGPGTGTFLIILLSHFAHFSIQRSAASTKAINLASNVGSLVYFLTTDLIQYRIAVVGAIFCFAGHYIGSGLVIKDGEKYVRPLILIVLGLLFIQLISELFL